MRNLCTWACLLLVSVLVFQTANAQGADVHPAIGEKTPQMLTGGDLMRLPARERHAWMHGNVSGMIIVLTADDPVQAKCVTDWYFTGKHGGSLLDQAFSKYSDQAATPIVRAVIQRVCPAG